MIFKTNASRNTSEKISAANYGEEKGVLENKGDSANIEIFVRYTKKTKAMNSEIILLNFLAMTKSMKV